MDDSTPATKADLAKFKNEIIAVVLQALSDMKRDLIEADNQILTVLTNVDKRLTKKVDDHEERIVALEAQVG